jgi:transcriptional regulator with XRE-family HTH domain
MNQKSVAYYNSDSNGPAFPLETYGHLIKRIRERQHISQMELARRTDLSVSFISSVENGQSQTSIGNAALICNALNVSLSSVFDTAMQVADIVDKLNAGR